MLSTTVLVVAVTVTISVTVSVTAVGQVSDVSRAATSDVAAEGAEPESDPPVVSAAAVLVDEDDESCGLDASLVGKVARLVVGEATCALDPSAVAVAVDEELVEEEEEPDEPATAWGRMLLLPALWSKGAGGLMVGAGGVMSLVSGPVAFPPLQVSCRARHRAAHISHIL